MATATAAVFAAAAAAAAAASLSSVAELDSTARVRRRRRLALRLMWHAAAMGTRRRATNNEPQCCYGSMSRHKFIVQGIEIAIVARV